MDISRAGDAGADACSELLFLSMNVEETDIPVLAARGVSLLAGVRWRVGAARRTGMHLPSLPAAGRRHMVYAPFTPPLNCFGSLPSATFYTIYAYLCATGVRRSANSAVA